MAMADYRLCDVCGGKAFYDSNLNYKFESSAYRETVPYRLAGKPQYEDAALLRNYGARLDNLGDWAVICHDCAKTHRCQIVPIENTSPSGGEKSP